MRILRRGLPIIVALLACGRSVPAEDLLPPDRPIGEVVDHYLDAALAGANVTPAPQADDLTLLRRLTLDLVGRIPTSAEARAYAESTEPEKRAKLVDRLMGSPGFVRHQAEALDAMLMAGVRGGLREYLARALGEGRPWDQVFREVLAADESDPARKGSAEFVKARAKDLDKLTIDVSAVFFGVNVGCTKCHDHPRVHDWKQDHFYGMKSFLGRTTLVGEFVGERDSGVVQFKTTKGVEKQARFMFLTGREVELPGLAEPSKEERQEEKRRLDEAKKNKTPPPPAKVSARGKLAEVALQPGERDFFAKSIVNRTWHRLLGHGLVMPLDQMHSENPPSHPELLAWLARDVVDHGYDLRRLTRGLVSSRAYARASRWESGEPPAPKLFAVGLARPLTPMQLATSMWVATADPQSLPADLAADALDQKVAGFEGRGRDLAQAIARPGEDYQIGASEALLLSNSDRLKDLLADGGDRLVGRMVHVQDYRERVDLAVRNILSRPPDDEEFSLLGEYLAQRADRPAEGCRQLVWSLLADSEFRFNH